MSASWIRGVLAGLLLAWAWLAGGCGRDPYSQDSPEDVLASALKMIKNGEADKLTRLIYADSREYRSVLNRFGTLMGSLQRLAIALKDRFPEDVEKLRQQLVETATIKATGEGDDALKAKLNNGDAALPTNIPKDREAQRRQRQQFEDLSQKILTNPFLYIEANAQRLSVERISDDTATVKADGEPILAGIIQMQKREGRWWIVLPLNLPLVSSFTPQTRNEWSIIGSLIKMADGVVNELIEDVRGGNIKRIEQLANKAGEKAFLPGGMIFIVYGKEMDVRRQRERSVRQFRSRAREWADARSAAGDLSGPLAEMVDALAKVGVERLDELVRKRVADPNAKLPKWEGMPESEFVGQLAAWLASVGDQEPITPVTEERAKRATQMVEKNLRGTIKPVTAYK